MAADFTELFDAIDLTALNAQETAAVLKKKVDTMIKKSGQDKSPRILISIMNTAVDNANADLLDMVGNDYDAIVGKVKEAVALEYDVSFTKAQVDAIASQKSTILSEIDISNTRLKNDIKRYMLQNLGGKLSLDQVVSTLQNLYPNYESNMYTLVNTYTQRISKDIEWTKTSEIADYFYYAGPKDEKNREYCAEHVGKAYTLSEAEPIQAEIMSFYNCRHRLEPITEEQYLAYKAAE